ncbi:Uma2 family endonuclease [bacterium]|nr:Uma2 family endonuclease [bacterium]
MNDRARTAPKRATVRDYLSLDDDRRYELIDGELVLSPSPFAIHQIIVMNLLRVFIAFQDRRKRLGRVFAGPIDVFLKGAHEDPEHVLVPDVIFLRRKNRARLERNGVHGVPDLVVEVLSSDKARDRVRKRRIYANAGLPELWLVDPEKRTVDVHRSTESGLELVATLEGKEKVTSESVPGLEVACSQIFRDLPRRMR